MTLTQAPSVPSVWRIVRSYLAVREHANLKDIFEQIRKHRPNATDRQLYDKLAWYKKRGDIKSTKQGTYALTQQGRLDISDPHETIGLPSWVPGAQASKRPIPDALQPEQPRGKTTRPLLGQAPFNSREHMAMMRQRLAEKRAAATTLGDTKKDLKAYTKQGEATTRAGKPAKHITIAGKRVAVDEDLIARLLERQEGLPSMMKEAVGRKTNQDHVISLPIGIRLKVTVEVV
jgi:hypothetical protein